MNRKERHSRSSKARSRSYVRSTDNSEATNHESEPNDTSKEGKLPPRRKKFPSSLNKVNKWYYNLLFVLFLTLVAFLFWYGHNFSS